VEFATLEWVNWSNHRRLLEPIGNIPPAEAEQRYYAMLEHLEAALAIADETQDGEAGNLERVLDAIRAAHWPTLDPNLEAFRKGRR